MTRPRRVLPVIVLAQFAGTSLWFAGNAVLSDLGPEWGLTDAALGTLTSSVQLGFIMGTLVFAILGIADRLSPRVVFFGCAVLAAVANAVPVLSFARPGGLATLVAARFLVGFFLAGIYPVGMKIAASWYRAGLGRALGLLVGALVMGTAFPHLLRAGGSALPWSDILLGVSALATLGGAALFFAVPEGPHLRSRSAFDPAAILRVFGERRFRAAALGYFGHMWELYAFWALVPALVVALGVRDGPLMSFLVIGSGALGCVGGGLVSARFGSARVAAAQVLISGVMCVVSPLLFVLPAPVALGLVFVWGIAVVGDSPQFSTLTAKTAPPERVGTALTIVTSVGFLLTVPSIQLLAWAVDTLGPQWAFLVLAPGPGLALVSLRPLLTEAGATR
ncbi:MAG: nitrate/nitrite transporter [Sandaracinaceae bacterium]